VVGDIDRGGVFASFYGTLALLDRDDQALLSAFVINKFRGDRQLLQPGIDSLTALTGRPTLGVVPWHADVWLDAEDSLAYGRVLGRPGPPRGRQWLRVAVVRLPRLSNATDVEALAGEPGVQVRLTVEPADLADADLVVLPGTKSTVDDLDWLRDNGLADAVTAHAAAGKPLLGICGGFQMLARRINDEVESNRGDVAGLGLLPVEVAFAPHKTGEGGGTVCTFRSAATRSTTVTSRRRSRPVTADHPSRWLGRGSGRGQRLRHPLAWRVRVR
jgi:adenosylcobyric acid synthase